MLNFRVVLACVCVAFIAAAAGWWMWHSNSPSPPPSPPSAPAASSTPPSSPPHFCSVEGDVFNQHGDPLAGVRIGYQREENPSYYTNANPSGHFQITGVSPGAYRFQVFLPEDETKGLPAEPASVTLTPGQDLAGLRLTVNVPNSAHVRGRVLDLNQKPIAGMELQCDQASPPQVVTGQDGTFLFSFSESEGDVTLRMNRGNYGERIVEGIAIGSEGLDIVIERGGTLGGQVRVEEDGKPVSQYLLRIEVKELYTQEYCLPEFETHIHSDEGRFLIEGIAPALVAVTVAATGFDLETQEVRLDQEHPIDDKLLFSLSKEEPFTGTVVNAINREAVANARIYLDKEPDFEYGEGYIAQTDTRGRFSAKDLPEGQATLVVAAKEGYHVQSFTVDTRRTPLILRLQPGAFFHGYVTYGGKPVPDAAVTLYRQGESNRVTIRRRRTDKNGYFEFTTLSEGRYTAEAANHLNPDDLFRRTSIVMTPGFEIEYNFEF